MARTVNLGVCRAQRRAYQLDEFIDERSGLQETLTDDHESLDCVCLETSSTEGDEISATGEDPFHCDGRA